MILCFRWGLSEKNARLRVLQRQQTSLRTLATGSECSNREWRSLPVRTLSILKAAIGIHSEIPNSLPVVSVLRAPHWQNSQLTTGSECLRAPDHQWGTLRTLATGSELGTLRTPAAGSELGILSRIPIQTSSECWRGDRGVERCKNIQYHLFNYHKSRSVYHAYV